MCGRFVRKTKINEASNKINVFDISSDIPVSYNISPGAKVVTLKYDQEPQWIAQHWGIIPNWVTTMPPYRSIINVRYETLLNRRIFNLTLKYRRCLILADGFYEWLKIQSKSLPYYFSLKENHPFFFAGIWNYIGSPDGKEIPACAIITVQANDLVKKIHERMPAIIPMENWEAWIKKEEIGKDKLPLIIKPWAAEKMTCYRVPEFVNSSNNDSPKCIQPVSEHPEKFEQLKLF